MLDTIINWLRFDAQNLIIEVWWAALALWLALVLVGIVDVAGNTLTRLAKIAWILAIVLLPMVGLFAYCIFSLTRVDYHWLEFLTMRRRPSRQRGSRITLK